MEKLGKQFEKTIKNSREVKNVDDSSHPQSRDVELYTESLLSAGSARSLCSLPICVGSLSGSSPSASEEALPEFSEKTSQVRCASARPLCDSLAELLAGHEGMSREDHQHTKNVLVHDDVKQGHQEFNQSEQLNCTCSCFQKNNKVVSQMQRFNATNSLVSQLQDGIATYQDRFRKQEDEINQLKNKLTQVEEEKQRLQADVGRQMFLQSKEKRRKVILQQLNGYTCEQSTLAIVTSTGKGVSCNGGIPCGQGSMDRSGHFLQYIIQEISDLLSKREIERIKNLVTSKVDLHRLARIRKGSELFKELKYKGELSCDYVKCLLEKIQRSDLAEKLVAPWYNSDELFKRECCSLQEGNQGYEGSERICVAKDRTLNKVEESGEISESADIYEEFPVDNPSGENFCDSDVSTSSSPNPGNSNGRSSLVDINYADSSSSKCGLASSFSQSTSSSAVYAESLMEDSHCVAPTISLNSDHALKVWENSGESTFDITSGGDEKQERSVSLSLTDESFESGEVKEWGAAKVEGRKEDLGSSFCSNCDGAVNGSYLSQHRNTLDVGDGPDCTSSRAQDSVKLKHLSDVSQDSLSRVSMPQKQNVSHATISAQKGAVHVLSDSCASNQFSTWEHVGAGPKDAAQKQNVLREGIATHRDSAVDQVHSYVSNQSHELEHLGARARDRTPKKDSTSDSSSLFSSLIDLVTQQVGEHVVQGVVNTFLARHSEDKHLHESLYYNNAEEMLAKDMDSAMNMIDPNKAKLCLGDCQVVTRSDSFYQPCSSVFPLTNGVYARANGEDGFPLSDTINGNYLPPPGPSYSCIEANTSQNSYFSPFNPNFLGSDFVLDTREPQLPQDGCFTSLQKSHFLQSGVTGSGLTSDLLWTTRRQVTHSVIGSQSNIGFTGITSSLPSEPLQKQMLSTTNVGFFASSSGSAQMYGNQLNCSTGFPTSSLVARAIGSDRRFLPWLESSRNTHLSPVSSARDSVNTSEHRNSNSTSSTMGNHLASGAFGEGDRAGNSSSSTLTSGANRGEAHEVEGEIETERRLQRATFVQESLDSAHNSSQQLEQDARDAWQRALAINPYFGRRGRL